ncbi:MAG: zinc-binding dehydrogenase [Pseudomonadota bacterium]
MWAVVTRGNGGYDQLDYCQVKRPQPDSGEVLIRVLAAGMNNTEINTRLGWYSSSVDGSTAGLSDSSDFKGDDGGWNESTPFPLIQGTDCCGEIIAVGDGISAKRIGERVLVRACMRPKGFDNPENIWMASDFDGAFAEYVAVPGSEAFAVKCDWSDAELATIPCAYGTSENMLVEAAVRDTDRVLVTGASGGVGSATVQLAKQRGAEVVAVVSVSKRGLVEELGADLVIDRDQDLRAVLGDGSVSLIVDNVMGDGLADRIKLLQRGGRLVTSGAIAGPMVTVDIRDVYLNDLKIIGCTGWCEPSFPNLVSYIEKNEIKPLLANTYPLADIVAAQTQFMLKQHVGNFVLIPS